MDKIGFGIIGCGMIGNIHASAISKVKEAKLVAVANPTISKAEKLATQYGVDYYQDYLDLLKRKDIEVVCICTPSGTHRKIAEDSANYGKNVLIEKPLEVTLEKCDEIIETCKKNKVKLGIVFQSRTYESSKKVKEIVDSGRLGKLILGDAYIKWYRTPEYYKSAGWRATWELDGGGSLMNQCIHTIDLLQWIMGPVETVFGYAETLAHSINVEDTAIALLKFRNGSFGVIEGTTSIYPGLPRRLEIHGKKGTIIIEDVIITKLDIQGEEIKLEQKKEERVGGASSPAIEDTGHVKQIEEFVSAIKENKEPLVTGIEARKSVEIILAIYKSAKTNTVVKLPL